MYNNSKEAIINCIDINLSLYPELIEIEKTAELSEKVLKIFKMGEHLVKQPKGTSVVDCQISYEFELRKIP